MKNAIEKNPLNIKAKKRISNIYVRIGKLKDAKFYLSQCLSIDSESNEQKEKTKQEIDQTESIIIKEGLLRKEYANKNYTFALNLTKELLDKCDSYSELKSIHVDCLLKNNLINEAGEYLRTSLSEEEKSSDEFIFYTCKVLYLEGKFEKAKSSMNFLIDKAVTFLQKNYIVNGKVNIPAGENESKNKNINISNSVNNTLNKKEAEKEKKKVQILVDKLEEYKNFKAKIEKIINEKEAASKLFIDKNFELAVDKYEKLIEIVDDNKTLISTLQSNIALCKQKLSLLSQAIKYINESIENNPSFAKAYFRRGCINIELGCLNEATDDFKRVLQIDPTFKDAKVKIEEIEMEKEKTKRKDYYKILMISYTADDAEIRQAYKKLAAKWHPDKHTSNEKDLLLARKMFEDITEAYDVLSNKEKKKAYDLGKEINHGVNEKEHFHSDEEDDYLYKKAEEIYYKDKNAKHKKK